MIKIKPEHRVTKSKPPVTKGRPKRYETQAEKQKAYRERVKAKTGAEWLAETVGADG
jgi:hypothetical protein